MKLILNLVFLALFLLVMFFGLGPVLLADGGWQERAAIAGIVIVIYVFLSYLYKKMVLKKK